MKSATHSHPAHVATAIPPRTDWHPDTPTLQADLRPDLSPTAPHRTTPPHAAAKFLNEIPFAYVTYSVTRLLAILAVTLPLVAAPLDLPQLLKRVEKRYNGTRTLQVAFSESFTAPGRPKITESGELYLRKPGRMRWEYRTPAGKLFMSDSKDIYYYNPDSKRAERSKFKESEDMRAPLAFLLGKLDFLKDFKDFRAEPKPAGTQISAAPKSDRMPYKAVEFLVSPDASIQELKVLGYDGSTLHFQFSNERMNPAISDNLFKFTLPAGATWAEVPSTGGSH